VSRITRCELLAHEAKATGRGGPKHHMATASMSETTVGRHVVAPIVQVLGVGCGLVLGVVVDQGRSELRDEQRRAELQNAHDRRRDRAQHRELVLGSVELRSAEYLTRDRQ
jgi:hypothetical protein